MTFSAFGRQIVVYRKKHANKSNRGAMAKIATDGHYLFLTDAQGKVIPNQIDLQLFSPLNGPPKVIVELFVNVDEIKKIEP